MTMSSIHWGRLCSKVFNTVAGFIISQFFRTTAVVTTVCFVLTAVCGQAIAAISQDQQSSAYYEKAVSGFALPNTVGRVTDAKFRGSDTVVVAIQDLHCHPEVQKNISRILSFLNTQYKTDNVYLEGAWGTVDVGWLSSIKDESSRQAITESLVNSGQLTGVEYFAANNSNRCTVRGLENEKIYKENSLRLKGIMDNRADVDAILAEVDHNVTAARARYFNTRQNKMEDLVARHKAGDMESVKYYRMLTKYGKSLNLPIEAYTNINGFLNLLELEKGINYKKLSRELNDYVKVLRQTLPYAAYQSLVERTANFSKVDELYMALAGLEKTHQASIDNRFPEVARFFRYLETGKQVNPLALIKEENHLVSDINYALSVNKTQQEIVFLCDFARCLKDFYTNKITAEDYEYYTANLSEFNLYYQTYGSRETLSKLQPYSSLYNDYCKANIERNTCFAANILGDKPVRSSVASDIVATGSDADKVCASLSTAKSIRVVVTGGFHTAGLTQILNKNNVSYLTITPSVTQDAKKADMVYARILEQQNRILSNAFALIALSLRPNDQKLQKLAGAALANLIANLDSGAINREQLIQKMNVILSNLAAYLGEAKKANIDNAEGLSSKNGSFADFAKDNKGNYTFTLTVDNTPASYIFDTTLGAVRRIDEPAASQENNGGNGGGKNDKAPTTIFSPVTAIVGLIVMILLTPFSFIVNGVVDRHGELRIINTKSLANDKKLMEWSEQHFPKMTLWDLRKTLHYDFEGKWVLDRPDLNVTITDGVIQDDERIKASLDTLEYLSSNKAITFVAAHLGKPQKDGLKDEDVEAWRAKYDMGVVVKDLQGKLQGKTIHYNAGWATPDDVAVAVKAGSVILKPGDIVVLNNVRLAAEEEKLAKLDTALAKAEESKDAAAIKKAKNDIKKVEAFTNKLYHGISVFVQDGMGVAHRKHVSTAGAPKNIHRVAGFGLVNDIRTLATLMLKDNVTLITGGAKVDEKIEVLSDMGPNPKVTQILPGGGILNLLLRARGINIAKSLGSDDATFEKHIIALKVLLQAHPEIMSKVVWPEYVTVISGNKLEETAEYAQCRINYVNNQIEWAGNGTVPVWFSAGDWMIVDVMSKEYVAAIEKLDKNSGVIMNGTVGVSELPFAAKGTSDIVRALVQAGHERGVYALTGGGDALAARKQFAEQVAQELGYPAGTGLQAIQVATGGGSALEYLRGKSLPGIDELSDKPKKPEANENEWLANISKAVNAKKATIAGIGATAFKEGKPTGWVASLFQRYAWNNVHILNIGSSSGRDKSTVAKECILVNCGENAATSTINPMTNDEAAANSDIIAVGVPEQAIIETILKLRRQGLQNKLIWVFGVPMEAVNSAIANDRPVLGYKGDTSKLFEEALSGAALSLAKGRMTQEDYNVLNNEIIEYQEICKGAQSMGEVVALIMKDTNNVVVNTGNNVPAFKLGNRNAVTGFDVDVCTDNDAAFEIAKALLTQADPTLKPRRKPLLNYNRSQESPSRNMESRTPVFAVFAILLYLGLDEFDALRPQLNDLYAQKASGAISFDDMKIQVEDLALPVIYPEFKSFSDAEKKVVRGYVLDVHKQWEKRQIETDDLHRLVSMFGYLGNDKYESVRPRVDLLFKSLNAGIIKFPAFQSRIEEIMIALIYPALQGLTPEELASARPQVLNAHYALEDGKINVEEVSRTVSKLVLEIKLKRAKTRVQLEQNVGKTVTKYSEIYGDLRSFAQGKFREQFGKLSVFDVNPAELPANMVAKVDFNIKEGLDRMLSTFDTVEWGLENGKTIFITSHFDRPDEIKKKLIEEEGLSPEKADAKVREMCSMLKVQSRLEEQLRERFGRDIPVAFETGATTVEDLSVGLMEQVKAGKIKVVLLENNRFNEGEQALYNAKKKLKKAKDAEEIKKLEAKVQAAQLAYDEMAQKLYAPKNLPAGEVFFVNDGFSASAKKDNVSIDGASRVNDGKMKRLIGIQFLREIKNLIFVRDNVKLIVFGGLKVSDKTEVITAVLKALAYVEKILVGGAMLNPILSVKGIKNLGLSAGLDTDSITEATKLVNTDGFNEKAVLPEDVVIVRVPKQFVTIKDGKKSANIKGMGAYEKSGNALDYRNVLVKTHDGILEGVPQKWEDEFLVVDIGSQARKTFFAAILEIARKFKGQDAAIFWNGTMGASDLFKGAAQGTEDIAIALGKAKEEGIFTASGGGDTNDSIDRMKMQAKFSFRSLGGGAAMTLFAQLIIDGIKALSDIVNEATGNSVPQKNTPAKFLSFAFMAGLASLLLASMVGHVDAATVTNTMMPVVNNTTVLQSAPLISAMQANSIIFVVSLTIAIVFAYSIMKYFSKTGSVLGDLKEKEKNGDYKSGTFIKKCDGTVVDSSVFATKSKIMLVLSWTARAAFLMAVALILPGMVMLGAPVYLPIALGLLGIGFGSFFIGVLSYFTAVWGESRLLEQYGYYAPYDSQDAFVKASYGGGDMSSWSFVPLLAGVVAIVVIGNLAGFGADTSLFASMIGIAGTVAFRGSETTSDTSRVAQVQKKVDEIVAAMKVTAESRQEIGLRKLIVLPLLIGLSGLLVQRVSASSGELFSPAAQEIGRAASAFGIVLIVFIFLINHWATNKAVSAPIEQNSSLKVDGNETNNEDEIAARADRILRIQGQISELAKDSHSPEVSFEQMKFQAKERLPKLNEKLQNNDTRAKVLTQLSAIKGMAETNAFTHELANIRTQKGEIVVEICSTILMLEQLYLLTEAGKKMKTPDENFSYFPLEISDIVTKDPYIAAYIRTLRPQMTPMTESERAHALLQPSGIGTTAGTSWYAPIQAFFSDGKMKALLPLFAVIMAVTLMGAMGVPHMGIIPIAALGLVKSKPSSKGSTRNAKLRESLVGIDTKALEAITRPLELLLNVALPEIPEQIKNTPLVGKTVIMVANRQNEDQTQLSDDMIQRLEIMGQVGGVNALGFAFRPSNVGENLQKGAEGALIHTFDITYLDWKINVEVTVKKIADSRDAAIVYFNPRIENIEGMTYSAVNLDEKLLLECAQQYIERLNETDSTWKNELQGACGFDTKIQPAVMELHLASGNYTPGTALQNIAIVGSEDLKAKTGEVTVESVVNELVGYIPALQSRKAESGVMSGFSGLVIDETVSGDVSKDIKKLQYTAGKAGSRGVDIQLTGVLNEKWLDYKALMSWLKEKGITTRVFVTIDTIDISLIEQLYKAGFNVRIDLSGKDDAAVDEKALRSIKAKTPGMLVIVVPSKMNEDKVKKVCIACQYVCENTVGQNEALPASVPGLLQSLRPEVNKDESRTKKGLEGRFSGIVQSQAFMVVLPAKELFSEFGWDYITDMVMNTFVNDRWEKVEYLLLQREAQTARNKEMLGMMTQKQCQNALKALRQISAKEDIPALYLLLDAYGEYKAGKNDAMARFKGGSAFNVMNQAGLSDKKEWETVVAHINSLQGKALETEKLAAFLEELMVCLVDKAYPTDTQFARPEDERSYRLLRWQAFSQFIGTANGMQMRFAQRVKSDDRRLAEMIVVKDVLIPAGMYTEARSFLLNTAEEINFKQALVPGKYAHTAWQLMYVEALYAYKETSNKDPFMDRTDFRDALRTAIRNHSFKKEYPEMRVGILGMLYNAAKIAEKMDTKKPQQNYSLLADQAKEQAQYLLKEKRYVDKMGDLNSISAAFEITPLMLVSLSNKFSSDKDELAKVFEMIRGQQTPYGIQVVPQKAVAALMPFFIDAAANVGNVPQPELAEMARVLAVESEEKGLDPITIAGTLRMLEMYADKKDTIEQVQDAGKQSMEAFRQMLAAA